MFVQCVNGMLNAFFDCVAYVFGIELFDGFHVGTLFFITLSVMIIVSVFRGLYHD